MKKLHRSVKALLLSALLYPGCGHFFLKKKKTGCLFVALFTLPLFIIMHDMITKINHIIARIENGELPFDLIAVTEAVNNIIVGTSSQFITYNIYTMLAIWMICVLDAYRLGNTNLNK